jgi:hypothetical protein
MPVPSQGHYGFHSFPVVDWFVCLYTYEFWLSLCKIVRVNTCSYQLDNLFYFNPGTSQISSVLLNDSRTRMWPGANIETQTLILKSESRHSGEPFFQQRGLYNGSSTNPTYMNYCSTVNSIILGQSLKSRGRTYNAVLAICIHDEEKGILKDI